MKNKKIEIINNTNVIEIKGKQVTFSGKALDEYEGAMILVSHVPEFVSEIRIDEEIDLSKFL